MPGQLSLSPLANYWWSESSFRQISFLSEALVEGVICFLRGLVRSISWGGWHAFGGGWSSLYVNGNDIGSLGRHSVWHWWVLCSMSGYAGLLKLLDATALKSLYANAAGGAPFWTVNGLSLPGFNGYITWIQVVFQSIRGGSVAEWLGRRVWNLEIRSSDPAMTTSWICCRQSLVQLFGCACTKPTGLPPASWDS